MDLTGNRNQDNISNATRTRLAKEAGTGGDASMSQGLWGLFRMWYWIILMGVFAIKFTNVQLHPSLHKHLTQRGVVLYVFHRMYEKPILEALYAAGLTDPAALTGVAILIVFAISFLIYFLVFGSSFTRMLCGIITVSSTDDMASGKRIAVELTGKEK